MKNEADVKKEVKKILKRYEPGVWWYMPVQTGYGTQGIPDFICCIKGRFVGIETKFGKNTLSAWQVKQCNAVNGANGVWLTLRETDLASLEDFLGAVMALGETE